MKNLSKRICCTLAFVVAASSAFAGNKNTIFTGYDFGEDTNFVNLGFVRAIDGDINEDSFVVRLSSGYGEYNYATNNAPGNRVEGQVADADAMIGYQKFYGNNYAKLFVGYNYQDQEIDAIDPSNRSVGGKYGAKVQGDFGIDLAKNVSLQNTSSYSSVYNNYYVKTDVMMNFAKFAVGPQAIYLGGRSFNQKRFGLGISKINVGDVSFSIASGYMSSTGKAGDEGAYSSVNMSVNF